MGLKEVGDHPPMRDAVAEPGVMSTTSADPVLLNTVGVQTSGTGLAGHRSATAEFGLFTVSVDVAKQFVQFVPPPSSRFFATA